METVRKSMRRMRVRKQVLHLDKEMNQEFQLLNDFQASFRRRESVRWMKGNKRAPVSNKTTLERELKEKMVLEDSVSLGATRMIAVSKSETQILEASKTLLLSSSRMQGLKEELSLVRKDLHNQQERSRLAEVSLSDLRIPLVWRQSDSDLHQGKQFAVFCLISCSSQIFDTSLKIVDRNCTDISFPEILVFSNLRPDFELKLEVYSHQMREETGRVSPSTVIKTIRERFSANKRKTENRAADFKLVTSKILTLEDSSGEVDSLDISPSLSHSSLELFGQLVCRLLVSPYTRWEAVRTGSLQAAGQQTWARLANWRLDLWTSSAAFRRGDQPVNTITVDRTSVVREEEGNIIIQNPNTEVIELRPGEGETSHWMRDILHHIKDSEDWQKAASSPMDVLSPSKEVERKKMRRKSKSKLMMLYNRVSCNDLMEFNLKRNERILRNRN